MPVLSAEDKDFKLKMNNIKDVNNKRKAEKLINDICIKKENEKPLTEEEELELLKDRIDLIIEKIK